MMYISCGGKPVNATLIAFKDNGIPLGDRCIHAGRRSPSRRLGCTKADVDSLRRIMNIYSFRPPKPVIDILAHVLASRPVKRSQRICPYRRIRGGPLHDEDIPPAVAQVLARTIVRSDALARRVAGDRTLILILASLPDPFAPVTIPEHYIARHRVLLDSASSRQERIAAIHRLQTAELMRILARNAEPSADIAEINAELSALADAVVTMCLELAAGEPTGSGEGVYSARGFIVLGLGKLGGRELNVSSDIDLIYLYDEKNGDTGSADMTRLAERLTRLLSEATEYGFLYRVDTRLRADGATGPLVRSLRDYYRYLEMRGEAWERQMLLKARPVAGDIEAGHSFLAALERFVFPGAVTRSPNREIAAVKAKIESRLASDGSKGTHLKLRPGGIRDIEFIVQCLQLLTGGMKPEVRIPGTLPALDALRNCEAITDAEHRVLREAYILYRKVEIRSNGANSPPHRRFPAIWRDLARLRFSSDTTRATAIPEIVSTPISTVCSRTSAPYSTMCFPRKR